MAIAGIGSSTRKRVDPTRFERVRPVVAKNDMQTNDPRDNNPTDSRIDIADPWRARCPEGHVSWVTRVDGYYCEACGERFTQLRDAKVDRGEGVATDGGHPFDHIDGDEPRIGREWSNTDHKHTATEGPLRRRERHNDWEAGVAFGWVSALVVAVVWRVLR